MIRDKSADLLRLTEALERCAEDDRLARAVRSGGTVVPDGNRIRFLSARLAKVADRLSPREESTAAAGSDH